MNSIRQKMSKIIDELVIFQFNAGADEIHMDPVSYTHLTLPTT